MIKCIIFDMDGVLTNTEPLHFRVWRQVFAEKGVMMDYEHYVGCIGSTAAFLYNLILEEYGKDFRQDPSIFVRFRELKNEILKNEGVPPIEGVPEVLAYLHEKGYLLAVASSSPQEYIELCTRQLGISRYFDLLFTGEAVPNPKPAPDVFLSVAQMMNMAPEHCLVVEDSRNGTLAAKAAGMYCMGFQNPGSGNQDLSAADKIFYPFRELIPAAGL